MSLRNGSLVLALLVAPIVATGQRAPQAPRDSSLVATTGLRAAFERTAEARARKKGTARYDGYFRKYSKRYFGLGFDWKYFKAQAMAESELNPNARSWVGARGLMQLMPSTYREIQSALPHFGAIDDPEWNIAAGILHDRDLWTLWSKSVETEERPAFMFGSYNAGEGTITRACGVAKASQLDFARWSNIEQIAPKVQRWRYQETIGYVRRIQDNYTSLNGPR